MLDIYMIASLITVNVRKPSYPELTRSISWLLMLWLLATLSHQHSWYWLWKIGKTLPSMRISSICFVSVCRNNRHYNHLFKFLLKILACKGLPSVLFSQRVVLGKVKRTTRTVVEGRKEVQTTRLLFPVKLHRRPLYYVVNLVVPTMILALLSAGVFIIPADSGEKISYVITILLAFFIFLLLLSENIPPSAGAGPLLGKIHRC